MIDLKQMSITLTLVLGVLLGLGCQPEVRVVRSSWDNWNKLEWAESKSDDNGSDGARGSSRGYTIELGTFSGPKAVRDAYQMIKQAREQAGLADLRYIAQGDRTAVYVGRFRARDDAQAKATLKQVRRAKVAGDRPFEDAKIVAVSQTREEVLDPRDLRTLKGKNRYALQIGYYDSNYGIDFRKAAETAVDVLREKGEDAYYYHGPNRSMVLLNAWTYDEAFTHVIGQADRYSPVVRVAQEKHPYNIPNGRSFTASDDPEYVKTQHSFLVPIR